MATLIFCPAGGAIGGAAGIKAVVALKSSINPKSKYAQCMNEDGWYVTIDSFKARSDYCEQYKGEDAMLETGNAASALPTTKQTRP